MSIAPSLKIQNPRPAFLPQNSFAKPSPFFRTAHFLFELFSELRASPARLWRAGEALIHLVSVGKKFAQMLE